MQTTKEFLASYLATLQADRQHLLATIDSDMKICSPDPVTLVNEEDLLQRHCGMLGVLIDEAEAAMLQLPAD